MQGVVRFFGSYVLPFSCGGDHGRVPGDCGIGECERQSESENSEDACAYGELWGYLVDEEVQVPARPTGGDRTNLIRS